MNRAPTYYQLLNISRTASADQIRSAYLRVMKRHHPDVAGGGSDASDFLPLINDVYKSLSDPAKRAAYDAKLAWEERARLDSRGIDLPGHPRWRGETAWRWGPARSVAGGLWAALFVLGLTICGGAIALAPDAQGKPDAVRAFGSTPSWLRPLAPSARLIASRSPSRSDISRYAHIGANLPEDYAAERSKSCFTRARAISSNVAAQLCVVMDDAFLYTHGAPRFSLSPYFNDVVVDLRHSSALDVAPDHPLLSHLWQATFAALMTELRAPTPEQGSLAAPDRPLQGASGSQNVSGRSQPPPLPQNGTNIARQRQQSS